MKQCVFFDKKNGEFTVIAENGKLKKESSELSYVKHNLLCFGRADKNSIVEPLNRNGSTIEYNDQRAYFSKAWIYFLEGNITESNMIGIINEFNKACDRDLKNGLFTKKISLKSISRLDKTTLLFKVDIGSQSQEIKLSL